MFTVDDAAGGSIRRAYEEGGELAAVVELRRRFPLIQDNEHARSCVHMIAGWTPVPPKGACEVLQSGSSRTGDLVAEAEHAEELKLLAGGGISGMQMRAFDWGRKAHPRKSAR